LLLRRPQRSPRPQVLKKIGVHGELLSATGVCR
jgi:hypothetical protein